ncbi:O-methyltransferase family 3 [Grosmannia clavigera kw1407]|uniref:O-methyltransferase family 3 n=1 Tax=Grosmannia clavigera (strain kw1407 / UAMH 11150) TaxID=655863 RepID=F0XGR3_GROCL|nr:O-methyltransferase family 3 [Grosmannia clavigera kw1407]EFX03230.1 O-methyltransferase family 3 [Grosmannia clavigera kw1407]
MKSNVATLFPNVKVATNVIEYAAAKSDILPEPLLKYHAYILRLEQAELTISTFQAQALSFLAKTAGAKRVLEIGVFRGFSSMVWSNAVGPSGTVTGLEMDEKYADYARLGFADVGVKNAEIIVGDALKTLAALDPEEPYDLIFIDAQKTGYPAYLQTILEKSAPGAPRRLLRQGGLIVADNVLRRGLVADYSADNPAAVKAAHLVAASVDGKSDSIEALKALDAFSSAMRENSRIDSLLVPLFDGIALGRLED